VAKSFLESHGFQVIVAKDGEDAIQIEAQQQRNIQLLVTDVVMPGMNGRALAERLMAKQPSMKVLYISGYMDTFAAVHGVLEKDMKLLDKPFTETQLIQKVREVLDS
jgi:hypothetical protein